MKASKMAVAILAGAAMVVAISGAAIADQYETIMQSGKLRVATDFAVPPYGMLDASLQPIGLDVEVARKLAADWGLELEFIETAGSSRIPNLLTDKTDLVISSLSITPDRAEVIDFSAPYSVISSVIGGAADDNVTSWDDLKGRAVAVARGTINDTDISAEADKYGFTVTRYEDDATLITAIVSGQSDLIGHAAATLLRVNEAGPALGFETKFVTRASGLGIGVKKGEPELVKHLNEWVAENLANGSLNEITERYTGLPLPEVLPTMAKK
ncbi:transporter substrate-binding domain-containing protein [Devosia sp. A449]